MNLMYHYDPNTALEELTEEATLPNPVHVRDMILRKKLGPDKSLELNRLFVEYQKFFGEAQKLGKEILKQLAWLRPDLPVIRHSRRERPQLVGGATLAPDVRAYRPPDEGVRAYSSTSIIYNRSIPATQDP